MIKNNLMLILLVSLLTTCLGCSYTSFVATDLIPQENGTVEVYFCPRDNCEDKFIAAMQSAEKIDCAFYDLDSEKIIAMLKQKQQVRLFIESDNYNAMLESIPLKKDRNKAYMHNKFCILDDKTVITGSTNPTLNDLTKNNNNLIIINSEYLAKNYNIEFEELGGYSSAAKTPYPKIYFNGFLIENYFCPEDNCEDNVVEAIETAKHSIDFMTFSFTSDIIGRLIEEKSKTLPVRGVFEKKQNSQYSEFNNLKNIAAVKWDSNPNMMHHKVFIIDNEIVITGSFNPTKNANENNDENILIIHNKDVASYYSEEFEINFNHDK